MTTQLSGPHEVTVLAARIDDGPHTRLSDSLKPPPSFKPFRDGGALVTPLAVPARRRFIMAPLMAHVTPGLRRYAYGRSRPIAAALVAQAVGTIIAQQARGIDAIHMWSGDLLATAAVRAGKLSGVPVVITPFAHEGHWGHDRASVLAYRNADRVIALLNDDARFYGRLGIEPRRIGVCGVCSPGIEEIERDVAKRRLGVTGPLIVFLGARRPYKGVDILLEAAPFVTAAQPTVSFAFLGPGPPLENRPAETQVLDVGVVDDADKAVWLSAADILCLPSEAEILPVSILEAWSGRTPVLTSDVPALVELVEGAGGGRCVTRQPLRMAQAMIEMLADPDQLRAMGLRGRQAWLRRYTPAEVARRHERMYAEARLGAEPDRELLPGLTDQVVV